MRTSRLEAFSDGVLAIIITIMVLGLKVPHGNTLADLINASGTGLLSYLLSFAYVGIYWNNHHHTFQLAGRIDGRVLWANLGLLFWLSLMPLTTAWVDETGFARVPVIVYGIDLLMAGTAYTVLQTIIIRVQGEGSVLKAALGRDRKAKASVALYSLGIIAALADTSSLRVGVWIALAAFVAVALMWVIPDRRIDRFYREMEDSGPAGT